MLRQPHARGLLTIAFFTLLCVASVAAQGGRIRPPDAIKCDPNHLTSFTGNVTSYRRTAARLSLRMRTDEETSEAFTLKFTRGGDEAIKFFLLRGEEFKAGDWTLIESRRFHLRPQMRATVWVCDDGSNPTIDWRPGERKSGSVF